VGDAITPHLKNRAGVAIKQFDERLYPIWVPGPQAVPDAVDLWIVFPASALGREGIMIPDRIQVSGRRMEDLLVQSVAVRYPQAARDQKITGAVLLKVIVAADGTVSQAESIRGHPLLVPAAVDAVKKWRYHPTLLNCIPVEVETEVVVP
jgi:TonB family protein